MKQCGLQAGKQPTRKNHLRKLVIITTLAAFAAFGGFGCSIPTSDTTATNSTAESTATTYTQLETIVVPTMPDPIPGYLEIDPDTGLHMTGKPTVVDFAAYRLIVGGLVDNELSLTYDEIRLLPKISAAPQLVCQGFFVDYASWSGASLRSVLELAKVQPEATTISLKSADGFSTSISLDEALNSNNFLAYELAGKTLPVLQGFPLRAVFPEQDGYLWVKWLVEIVVK